MTTKPDDAKPSLAERIEAIADARVDMQAIRLDLRAIAGELRAVAGLLKMGCNTNPPIHRKGCPCQLADRLARREP